MKLLDQKFDSENKEKEDFSSLLNTVDTILSETNSKPLTQIPSYFYQNEGENKTINKGFLARITISIQKIKSIFYTIKNFFGPFKATKADFQKESLFRNLKKEIADEKNVVLSTNLDKVAKNIVNTTPQQNSVTPQISSPSQEQKPKKSLKPQVMTNQVRGVKVITLDVTKTAETKPQPLTFSLHATYIEKVFVSLPSLKEVFSQYSTTISTYFQSLTEKKPRKVQSYSTIVESYEESFQKTYDLQKAITTLTQAYPKVKRPLDTSSIHPLEPLYFSQLLPHTITHNQGEVQEVQIETEELKESEPSSEITQEFLSKLKTVFLSFSPNILSKTYTELLHKTQYFYDVPSTKRLKPLDDQNLELSLQSPNVSFQVIKRLLPLEIQMTIDEISTMDEFNKGREAVWNWQKTHQAESINETAKMFEYGLMYLKTITTINKRYIEILKSHLKNLKNIEKVEKQLKVNAKKLR